MSNLRIMLSALVLSLFVSGCASKVETPKDAEGLYRTAYKELKKDKFKKSAKTFEQLELEHPYSKWAVKSKLMGAYAHYRAEEYDDALMSLDRFIRFHPGNKDIAYAYYLKAICYYDQIDIIGKNQKDTREAFDALNQVILRFPDTAYARDARSKINLAENYLAGQNMYIGRFYLNEKQYLSALNRFSTVVNDYQTTAYVEEALYRQIEIYTILGLKKESQNNYRVLSHNFPKSDWTKRAKKIMKG
ncbi:MAG: outer membrane protein assembly factor BamD [Alphaproteobacteria bacterium]|nr:outer membrane protein assembly factor BamD [Alphaproteobacteria bacterium]